jgi:hypothetical protein
MPFELSNSLKNTCGWSFASKGMNGLFVSKFYTTAILTIMIIILIMIIYPCQKNTPAWVLGKLGFYIFIVSLGVIFVHDCVIYHTYEKEVNENESSQFIGGLDGGENIAFSGSSDVVDVSIGGKMKENDAIEYASGGDEMIGFGECSGVAGGDSSNVVGGDSSNVVGGDSSDSVFAMYGV